MIRIFSSLLLTLACAFNVLAQKDETLLTINNQPISKVEFEYIYNKNNTNLYNDSDKKSPKEYLDLFIDFKLKVIEAEALKMDTSQSFINELAGYRKEVAAPYLTDVKYTNKLVHELYRRMTLEVNASHILLRLDKNATPDKCEKVLDKINTIRQEIQNGKDFGEAAFEYSEDPSAKTNKGQLGYFTAFMMVAPFEDAAFSTAVGEISQPVRSSFGYHLIRVNDLRKNQGEIHVAHIMKNAPKNASPEIKQNAKKEINAIYEQLVNGADFTELAKKESDDKKSAVKGGEMPWFSAGRIVPEFSKAAFALENIGDISKPIQTDFGFHIIKKLGIRDVPSFEDSKENIEMRIKKDPERRTSSKRVFIEKLKTAYHFSENSDGKNTIAKSKIEDAQKLPTVTLFTLSNKNFTTTDLTAYIKQEKISKGTYLSVYDNWVEHEITAFEDSRLEEKYPAFRYLMNEYHDGILLFNISQEKIWNFASEDSVGLQHFYEKNKDLHQWDVRFKGSIIQCDTPETREKAENLLGEALTVDEVATHLNSEKEVIKIETGAWEQGQNPIVDYYVWNKAEPENFDSSLTFVRGNKINPAPKQLDEARGLYVSDYQNYLEAKWLKELHQKYKVKINKKVLKTVSSD